jgi:rubrerythrin
MRAKNSNNGLRKGRAIPRVPNPKSAKSNRRPRKEIDSLGMLYAHALAIEHEAAARYREFASHMADYGNDRVANLFVRLSQFEGEHAFHLAKKSLGVKIPALAPGEYAWLDCGAPLPEARALVYRMMTPRAALEIALRAEERAKAFFERVCAETCNDGIRELAAEFVLDEVSHIAWVNDALAHLPTPYQPSEDQPGDPTIEQQA